MPSRMAAIPTASRIRKLVSRGIVPIPKKQLLLPFDKLAAAHNRESPRGIILRLLKLSNPQMKWKVPRDRRLLAESDRWGGLKVDASTPNQGLYDPRNNEIRLGYPGMERSPRGPALEAASTLFHEFQHARELNPENRRIFEHKASKLPLDQVRPMGESRAMLREVSSTRKIFGAESLMSPTEYAKILLNPRLKDYHRGAMRAIQLVKRATRK